MKLKKKSAFWLTLWSVFVLIGLTGCGGDSSGTDSDSSKNERTSSTRLYVVNWKDYGSDDPEVIQEFQEMCNCEVIHQYMASEEELLTKLRTIGSSEMDVVLPNASILPTAIEEGLLEEIDTSQLENYDALDPSLTELPEVSHDGKTYAVPWVWGSTSIAYNTEVVDEDINSINVLFDERYAGNLSIRDDYNDAVMAAAIALGQDPNNPSDLDAVKEKLKEQKQLNKTYWKTGEEFTNLFSNNLVSVAMAWSGQVAQMKQEGLPIDYVIPKEGAIGWVDNWAIVKDTPKKELAMQFIDFMISREFQESWAKKGGPAPANTEAINNLDPDYVAEIGMDEESLSKLHFISYRSDEQKNAWNDLWQEVKAE